jgi:hypothetical protein
MENLVPPEIYGWRSSRRLIHLTPTKKQPWLGQGCFFVSWEKTMLNRTLDEIQINPSG